MYLADSPAIDLGQLANYGVLGIMFIFVVGALLTGKMVAGWVYKQAVEKLEQQIKDEREACREQRERYEADLHRERDEKTALRAKMDNDVVPLLTDTGHLLREALRTLGRGDGHSGPRGGGS